MPRYTQEIHGVAKKDMDDVLARAKKAQEQRRAVTDIKTLAKITLPMKELLRRFAPDCVGKDAPYHPYFGRPEDTELLIERGYEPVVPPERGEQLKHEGLLAWKLPKDLHMQNMAVSKVRSDTMLGEAVQKGAARGDAGADEDISKAGFITENTQIIKPDDPKYPKAGRRGATG